MNMICQCCKKHDATGWSEDGEVCDKCMLLGILLGAWDHPDIIAAIKREIPTTDLPETYTHYTETKSKEAKAEIIRIIRSIPQLKASEILDTLYLTSIKRL